MFRVAAGDDEDDRGYHMAVRYYGIEDGKTYTLEDIGSFYSITRERTRQIRDRITDRIRSAVADGVGGTTFYVPAVLSRELEALRDLLQERGPILSPDDVEACLATRYGPLLPRHVQAYRLLVPMLGFAQHTVSGAPVSDLWSMGLPGEETAGVAEISQLAWQFLRGTGDSHSLFDICVTLNKERGRACDPVVVAAVLEVLPGIEQPTRDHFRVALHELPSLGAKARRVLADEGQPLHFRVIARRINQAAVGAGLKPSAIKPAKLGSHLSGSDGLVPIGRKGAWTLTEWSHVRTESTLDLMKEALMAKQAASTIDEIFDYVSGFQPDTRRSTVASYLHMYDDIFLRSGEGRYELVSWGGKAVKSTRRSSAAVLEQVRDVLTSLVEETEKSTWELRMVVSEVSRRTGIPESTVRARLKRSDWAQSIEGPDGRRLLTVDVAEMEEDQVDRTVSAPVTHRIEESVRSFLAGRKGGRAAVVDVWKHVQKDTGDKQPTIYSVLDKMTGLEKAQDGGRLICWLQGFSDERPLLLQGLDLVETPSIAEALEIAQGNLTLEQIDTGLLQLGRAFEAQLRRLLRAGQVSGSFAVVRKDFRNLSSMITAAVREGEVRKKHELDLLREHRNARAHEDPPSPDERRKLLLHAPFVVDLYMKYIVKFDRRVRELSDATKEA